MKKMGTGLLLLISKFGAKLFPILVKLVKFLKFGKLALAGLTFASYAYLLTWKFAVMIMFMLFVHESGHVWAMRRSGIKTKGIYFLPFIGGAAVAEERFPSRESEVFVAIMGPVWGFVLALIIGFVYLLTKNQIFAAAASWMAMVNLVNLLPINPLDGGRIVKSIAYSIHSRIGFMFLIFGLIASLIIAIEAKFFLFILLLVAGGVELAFEYKRRENHTVMSVENTLASTLAYTLIICMLWGLMAYMNHVPGADIAMKIIMG